MQLASLLATRDFTFSFDVHAEWHPLHGLPCLGSLRPDFICRTLPAQALSVHDHVQSHPPCLVRLSADAQSLPDLPTHLTTLAQKGVHNLLVDITPPLTRTDVLPHAAIERALQMIAHHASGSFCAGSVCFPEEGRFAEEVAALQRRMRTGCSFLLARDVFDNDVLYRFLCRLHAYGVCLPLIVAITPLTRLDTLMQRDIARLPPRLRLRMERYRTNPAALRAAGLAYAAGQIVDLLANGIRRIHIHACKDPQVLETLAALVSHLVAPQSPEEQTARECDYRNS